MAEWDDREEFSRIAARGRRPDDKREELCIVMLCIKDVCIIAVGADKPRPSNGQHLGSQAWELGLTTSSGSRSRAVDEDRHGSRVWELELTGSVERGDP